MQRPWKSQIPNRIQGSVDELWASTAQHGLQTAGSIFHFATFMKGTTFHVLLHRLVGIHLLKPRKNHLVKKGSRSIDWLYTVKAKKFFKLKWEIDMNLLNACIHFFVVYYHGSFMVSWLRRLLSASRTRRRSRSQTRSPWCWIQEEWHFDQQKIKMKPHMILM